MLIKEVEELLPGIIESKNWNSFKNIPHELPLVVEHLQTTLTHLKHGEYHKFMTEAFTRQ